MAFPDLQMLPDAKRHAAATGVPVNGNNTIKLPFRPEIIRANRLVVDIWPLGASVAGATEVSIDEEAAEIVVNFAQSGGDAAYMEARLIYPQVF